MGQKHRQSFHPYHHFLMLDFLGMTIADVTPALRSIDSSRESAEKSVAIPAVASTNPKIRVRLEERRQMWLQLQKEYPKCSKIELHKMHPAVYTYLYRYDRNWLETNSPKYHKPKVVNNRIYWEKRGEAVLQQVMQATAE